MAYSFRHTTPELAGVLIKESVRCGKSNCRCLREQRLHQWYYYLYWRDYRNGGRLRKQYVPQAKVRQLRQRIEAAKAEDRQENLYLQRHIQLLNQLL